MAPMSPVPDFWKDGPAGFEPSERICPGTCYKYYLCGKGCTLGVLFEDSVHLYLEWLTEGGAYVSYPAALRYKAWPKHEVGRLVAQGVWDVSHAPDLPEQTELVAG